MTSIKSMCHHGEGSSWLNIQAAIPIRVSISWPLRNETTLVIMAALLKKCPQDLVYTEASYKSCNTQPGEKKEAQGKIVAQGISAHSMRHQ